MPLSSGITRVVRGGTGVSTLGDAGVLIGNGTGAVQVTGAGTSGQVLTSNGVGVDPTFQTASGGANMTVVVPPHAPRTGISDGTMADYNAQQCVAQLADSVSRNYHFSCQVPSGATSISSITVYYMALSTGNLYLKFNTGHSRLGSDVAYELDDTDTSTTYGGVSADGKIRGITVPAAAYNALTNIVANDLIDIQINRDATNAADTFADIMQIPCVEFVFA